MSSHVTTCHACHAIYTVSPLHAAVTMRLAKNTQRDTSEVLHLPRKMTMEVSSAAPARKHATHLLKALQNYCSCHTKPLSTRLQTRENVRKCQACHAKRHDNLLGNLRKGKVLQLPPHTHTATAEENQRIETRHVGASKRAFRARPPPIFIFCSFKIDVFLRVFS
jgi:hypothetical protein